MRTFSTLIYLFTSNFVLNAQNFTKITDDALVNYQSIDTLDATTLNALALYEQYYPATSAHSYAKAWLRRVLGNDYPLYVPVMLKPLHYNVANIETTESSNKLHLYPNPAAEIVYIAIDYAEEASIVELIDATGKLVLSFPVNKAPPYEVNLSGVATGIYTVRLVVDEQITYTGQLQILSGQR